jgi:2-keto-4-pentenoate hydratase/2-oxohepta-3-ene-1,7-dioic acid hydratase in catechol pathway
MAGDGFGLLSSDGSGVVDLGRRFGDVDDLAGLIGGGRLHEAGRFEHEVPDHRLVDIRFQPVIPHPGKIFCIGVNYGGRAAEYADRTDAAYPSVFLRFPDSFTGHEQPIIRPPESHQLDYEGEIVVVIGRSGRRIPLDDANHHIAGLTLGNEGTVRDWVRHAKFNVTQGKNWNSSGSIGPWMVPMDEIGDLDELHLTTRVNGELRQDDTPASMKYSIPYQIHYLSAFTDLRPGDLIFTGTPTGAGARFDPPRWLVPGDVVEVTVPEIGTLRNIVADEFDPSTAEATRTPPEPR